MIQLNNSTNRRYTPEYIESLDENEVFVFGSNLSGRHGGGAAYAEAINLENIVLPKSLVDAIVQEPQLPNFLLTKIHGQTETLVDMLIELNKEYHFTEPEEAIKILREYIQRLRIAGDSVAFNCSVRSLWSCCDNCFPNGKLDISLLRNSLNHLPYKGIQKVYADYVIAKTVKLIEMMNEFRHYTNPRDIADDFIKATGGVNNCGPQDKAYYFGFDSYSGINYICGFLSEYVFSYWDTVTIDGVLDNKLFRELMVEKHQKELDKYDLDDVIKRNYEQDSACHPEVYVPKRGYVGPVYVRDEEARKWIHSCGEGKGPNRRDNLFEYNRIVKCLKQDKNYIIAPSVYSVSYGTISELFLIPRKDNNLPIFDATPYSYRRVSFDNERDRIDFVEQMKKNIPCCAFNGNRSYKLCEVEWGGQDAFYWHSSKNALDEPIYKVDSEGFAEVSFQSPEDKLKLIKSLEDKDIYIS